MREKNIVKIKIEKSQISKEVTVIAEALGVTAKLFAHHFIKFNLVIKSIIPIICIYQKLIL